jgi:ferredoxin-type protein NapG
MLKPGESTRRELLRSALGDWLERLVARTEERVVVRRYFRPPGALAEIGFLAACTRCGACTDACPPHAIVKVPADGGLAAGTPHLDFSVEPCAACPTMPCAAACPTGALTVPPAVWSGHRVADVLFHADRCLTFQGTACRVCADACPVGEAALTIDDAGHPVLRREGCVGCGICAHVCVTTLSSFELTAVGAYA